jgi:hypothetical protein
MKNISISAVVRIFFHPYLYINHGEHCAKSEMECGEAGRKYGRMVPEIQEYYFVQ